LGGHFARSKYIARFQYLAQYLAVSNRSWCDHRGIVDHCFQASRPSHNLLEHVPFHPDVIHCHNLHGRYFDLRALPMLSKTVPVVMTLHDEWSYTGRCACSLGCEHWRKGCAECPQHPRFSLSDAAINTNWNRKRSLYAGCKLYITTPSQWLLDRAKESILQTAMIASKVIYNGIDLTIFAPRDKSEVRSSLGLPKDADIALFTSYGGKANPNKDYQTMRSAVEQIAATPRQRPFIFIVLGGEGPTKRIGNVTFQFVSYQKSPNAVASYYQAADVYLHAAKGDTFPTTVIEALACGTPVVATAVGGIPEQIVNGETGFLTPPGDARAMAQAVDKLLDDRDLRYRLSSAAVTDAKKRFDQNRMIQEYLDWYAAVIQDCKARREGTQVF
ncbi:MAG TPA: glycosyltransferase, partial [Armatimonadota bacterium]|nr:glycosyltransferase [Armatimonadota bacterium]